MKVIEEEVWKATVYISTATNNIIQTLKRGLNYKDKAKINKN